MRQRESISTQKKSQSGSSLTEHYYLVEDPEKGSNHQKGRSLNKLCLWAELTRREMAKGKRTHDGDREKDRIYEHVNVPL